MSKLGSLHFTKPTGPGHSATVIFFHGSGSSGANMKEWVRIMHKNFSFPYIKVLYPTAPLQPYTPCNGEKSNVWFDRFDISPMVPEKIESIAEIETEVKRLIKNENDVGIPSSRIIVGGFSMGGSLSYHTAFKWDTNLAGVFVMSSFLNHYSTVYQELQNDVRMSVPPLLQIHGESDYLVPFNWGQTTFNRLKELGVQGEFYAMGRLGHSINRRGMTIVKEWIEKQLPEK